MGSGVKFVLLTLFFFAWLVAYLLSYDIAVYSRVVLQFFAGGVSFWKPVFFLVWAVLASLLLVSSRWPMRLPSLLVCAVILSVPVLLQAVAHLWFCQNYALGFWESVTAVHQGRVSITSAIHTHVLKSVLALCLELIQIDRSSFIGDAGYAYHYILPLWLQVAALVSFVAAVVLLFWILVAGARAVATPGQLSWILLFIISSYAVAKAIIDGGPLSSEAVVFSAAVWVLVRQAHTKQTSNSLTLPLLILSLSLLTGAGYLVIGPEYLWYPRDLGMMAAFAIGLYFFLWGIELRARRALALGLFGLAVAYLGAYGHYFRWSLEYLATPIKEGDQIYFVSRRGFEVPDARIRSIDGITVSEFRATSDGKIIDLLRPYRLAPDYRAVQVPGKTCHSGQSVRERGEILSRERLPNPLLIEPGYFSKFSVTECLPGERCAYRYEAVIEQCLHMASSVMVATRLNAAGLDLFVIARDSGLADMSHD